MIKILGPPGKVTLEVDAMVLSDEFNDSEEDEDLIRKLKEQKFKIRFEVNLRKCIKGEIIKFDRGLINECYECPANLYSLKDPHNFKDQL